MAEAPENAPPPVKKEIPLRKQIPFELVGRGFAGVDEMRESLDNTKVTFGLLQVVVGTGSFARAKNIFIHFNGEDIPPMKRSKANKFLKKAHKYLEPYQLAMTLTRQDECTIDHLFKEAKGIFVSDNISKDATTFSLESLKEDYQRKMAEAKAKAEQAGKQLEESKRRMVEKQAAEEQAKKEAEMAAAFAAEEEARRLKEEEEQRLADEAAAKEAAERAAIEQAEAEAAAAKAAKAAEQPKKKKRKIRRKRKPKDDWGDDKPWTGKRVVACIHADASPFNWAVFQPSNKEIIPLAYGHGDLGDLRRALKPDQVQYGLMRLTFGQGRFRRNHFVFIIWAPESMSRDAPPRIRSKKINERMTCITWKGVMGDMIGPYGVEVTADDYDKVSLEDWILRVRRTVAVDGGDDFLSAEGFRKALEEEKKLIEEMEKARKAKLESGKKAAKDELSSSEENVSDLDTKAKEDGSGGSKAGSATDDPESKSEDTGADSAAPDANGDQSTTSKVSSSGDAEEKSADSSGKPRTSSDALTPPKKLMRGSIAPEEAKRRDLASRMVQESVTLVQRQDTDIVWVLIEPRVPGSK